MNERMNPTDGDSFTTFGARHHHHHHPGDLAVENVRTLAPYVPGKPIEELERDIPEGF